MSELISPLSTFFKYRKGNGTWCVCPHLITFESLQSVSMNLGKKAISVQATITYGFVCVATIISEVQMFEVGAPVVLFGVGSRNVI